MIATDPITTTHNSIISFGCNTGYVLNGSSTITCVADGSWTDDVPVCTIVNCTDPGTPSDGTRSGGNSYSFNSQLTYSCDEGYELSGSSVIVCLSTGNWSDVPPVCNIRNCGSPGNISNGQYSGNNLTYNSRVTFECDSGYVLLGSRTIVCQSNGRWNDSIPECEESDELPTSGLLSSSDVITTTSLPPIIVDGSSSAVLPTGGLVAVVIVGVIVLVVLTIVLVIFVSLIVRSKYNKSLKNGNHEDESMTQYSRGIC